MYYPDLNNECQVDRGLYVRAIGWLSAVNPIPKGQVPSEFVDALRRHLTCPWQPVVAGGAHNCEICQLNQAQGRANVWIPTSEVVYVAPELILHYLVEHEYKPPDEFISAVIDCPEQWSNAYFSLMRKFPAWWVEFCK
ncbi:MAG: DUF7919 family protein [Limisphaerales bacterium]